MVKMKKRISEYILKMDSFLEHPDENTDWEFVLRDHLTQIGFYSHERVVHLIVTVVFALMALGSVAIGIIGNYPYAYLLTLSLFVLLIPYVMHYFFLENSVQHMYVEYDRILSYCKQEEKKESE